MASVRTIEVATIRSAGRAEALWLARMIGRHPRVFTLGDPAKIGDAHNGNLKPAGLNWAGDKPVRTALMRDYDPAGNLYHQVAEAVGTDRLVIVGEQPHGLDDPCILVRPIHLVRDGRVLAQRQAGAERDFLDAVLWLSRTHQAEPVDPQDPDALFVRHEDVTADVASALARIWAFLDLPPVPVAADDNAGEDGPTALSRRELFLFDLFCGARNAAFGYGRDRFDLGETAAFLAELSEAVVAQAISLNGHPAAAASAAGLAPLRSLAGSQEGTAVPRLLPLDRQLRPRHLKAHGLHLSPLQLSRLYRRGRSVLMGAAAVLLATTALVLIA